jgi:hypothetical protein
MPGAPDIWLLPIQDSRDVNNRARWRRKHRGLCDAKACRRQPINQSGRKTSPENLGSRWFSHITPLTGGQTVTASELCPQIAAVRPIARIAIRAMGIPPLPDGPGQLHREPVVSLGCEMNMVSL